MARGDEPADVVVRGGRVLSVFTREWLEVDVAVVDGWIAGLGEYEGTEIVDASGTIEEVFLRLRKRIEGIVQTNGHLD